MDMITITSTVTVQWYVHHGTTLKQQRSYGSLCEQIFRLTKDKTEQTGRIN